MRYNPPPNWPPPPEGWTPPPDWQPDPAWPAPPSGWELYTREPGDPLWEAVGRPLRGFGAGKYKLTEKFLLFERGTLRTDSQQVPIAQVVDVDVRQSMTQKARGVGTMIVHIKRAQRVEKVVLEDIPNFREGQRIINETAHEAKVAEERRSNTRVFEGAAIPQPQLLQQQPAATPAVTPPATDLIAQLGKLGELHSAGVLTNEEFAAKKSEILARL